MCGDGRCQKPTSGAFQRQPAAATPTRFRFKSPLRDMWACPSASGASASRPWQPSPRPEHQGPRIAPREPIRKPVSLAVGLPLASPDPLGEDWQLPTSHSVMHVAWPSERGTPAERGPRVSWLPQADCACDVWLCRTPSRLYCEEQHNHPQRGLRGRFSPTAWLSAATRRPFILTQDRRRTHQQTHSQLIPSDRHNCTCAGPLAARPL